MERVPRAGYNGDVLRGWGFAAGRSAATSRRPSAAEFKEKTMAVPETMQAVRVHGVEDYRLETIPVPSVGPGEVLVRVLATGVCASDVKAYHGSRVWGSDEIAPYIQPPVTPGHEFVGEVVALGEGAGERDGLQVGDWAISEQIIPCGECRYCRRGQY